jgi:hypothetical protein
MDLHPSIGGYETFIFTLRRVMKYYGLLPKIFKKCYV